MASIQDILAAVKPRTKSVSICLRGDLAAEHDSLQDRLDRLQAESVAKMGGQPEQIAISGQIVALETQMSQHMQEFRMKGLSEYAIDALQTKYPAREGKRESWNIHDAAPELVSASAVDPAMTVEQARQLGEALSAGDWDRLVSTAWEASNSNEAIPFSVRASALISTSGQK